MEVEMETAALCLLIVIAIVLFVGLDTIIKELRKMNAPKLNMGDIQRANPQHFKQPEEGMKFTGKHGQVAQAVVRKTPSEISRELEEKNIARAREQMKKQEALHG